MEALIGLMIGLLVGLVVVGAGLTIGGMITALLDLVFQGRHCGGGTRKEDAVLHAQRLLAHFDKIRDAVLAGDDARLRILVAQLRDIDLVAWADFRTQLRKNAKRAGITIELD